MDHALGSGSVLGLGLGSVSGLGFRAGVDHTSGSGSVLGLGSVWGYGQGQCES